MIDFSKKNYENIDETLYSITFNNGLTIYLIPKIDFKEVYGMLSVNFGSLDTKFTVEERDFVFPEGVAHFLEHKLFELEDGQDVSQKFTALGAEINAFTSFDKTCYYFSTIDNVGECLNLLQSFVKQASFSENSIAHEKEIIGQEIDMYQDDADYCLYQGILGNLYPHTSLAEDIAGTRESIDQISLFDLIKNHRIFYSPERITLLLVGGFNIGQILKQIEHLQKDSKKSELQIVSKKHLNYEKVISTRSIHMDVAMPKLAIGYRGNKPKKEKSLLRQELGLKVFFSMLLGWTSKTYQSLYETGKIDDSFDFEVEVYPDFQFLVIYLDTVEPIAMSNRIRQFLKKAMLSKDLSFQHFKSVKKAMFGDFLRSLDSIEQLSTQFINHLGGDENYFDIPELLESLSLDEVLEFGKNFIEESDVTDFTILPK